MIRAIHDRDQPGSVIEIGSIDDERLNVRDREVGRGMIEMGVEDLLNLPSAVSTRLDELSDGGAFPNPSFKPGELPSLLRIRSSPLKGSATAETFPPRTAIAVNTVSVDRRGWTLRTPFFSPYY